MLEIIISSISYRNFIMKKIKNLISIISEFNFGEINSKSAEMSFYLLLSLFPFLMFTISTVAYIPIIHLNKYIDLLKNIMPESAYNLISSLIISAVENRSFSFILMSFCLTVWALSNSLRALIKAMNKSYRIKENRSYIKRLILSFIFAIGLLLLIFSSAVFLVYGEKIGIFIFSLIKLDMFFIYIWNLFRLPIGILTVVIILMCLYKFIPSKNLTLKDVLPGAIISIIGWLIVSFLYSFYANSYARYEMIYGSIGGIIVLITWLYLSSWMILFGNEINVLFYNKRYKGGKTYGI
jgi:membrane protein